MKRPDYRHLQFTCAVLWGLFITTAVFTSFPVIDLWVANLFAAPGGGFPLLANPVLGLFRKLYGLLFIVSSIVVAIMFLFNLLVRLDTKVPIQIWGFACAVFLLGPGLLANVILKNNWGRARPSQIQDFGGTANFTPPFLFTDQCERNCSFVSGEVSAISSVMIILVVLLWHTFPDKRRLLVSGATIIGIAGASLRIVEGRHFLSDALFAALFNALIILGLYGLLNIRKHRQEISRLNLRHDFMALGRYISSGSVQPNLRLDIEAVGARLANVTRRIKDRFM